MLAVNQRTAAVPSEVEAMTAGKTIPLLQDTAEQNVYLAWAVTYRDVVILDASNEVVGVYNLTANDLGLAENRAALKAMLLSAAEGADVDADDLLDVWEKTHFKGLSQEKEADPDGDGHNNFVEFFFGTDPNDAASEPELKAVPDGNDFLVEMTHWSGYIGDAVFHYSSDLRNWAPQAEAALVAANNLYDSTGRSHSIYRIAAPPGSRFGFVRAAVKPRD